jgi:Lon protease-like protein
MAIGGYATAADLPQVIPVFPLDGALLLPHGSLPLNIFEPRYLNMIDDAMAGERLIGMVQTLGGDASRPNLAKIGCAGRITSYAETSDGRYIITLTGLCRFRVQTELPVQTPYRQVRADFAAFAGDLHDRPEPDEADRADVLLALKAYLERRGMAVDWRMAEDAPMESLVNSLSMALPFEQAEKQALLEAADVEERRKALVALLRIDAEYGEDDEPPSMQ